MLSAADTAETEGDVPRQVRGTEGKQSGWADCGPARRESQAELRKPVAQSAGFHCRRRVTETPRSSGLAVTPSPLCRPSRRRRAEAARRGAGSQV